MVGGEKVRPLRSTAEKDRLAEISRQSGEMPGQGDRPRPGSSKRLKCAKHNRQGKASSRKQVA